jgi:DNA helicase-2/ATP-dependent DNA helicase PcrA
MRGRDMGITPGLAEVLEGLNPSQREAVEHTGGPLLVLAGAGSGKTRTLVCRAAWLISQGVDPGSILLMTFTRKAAAEMLQRCRKLVGSDADRVQGGTFHSVAAKILRQDGGVAGYGSKFTIMDAELSEKFLKLVMADMDGVADRSDFPDAGEIMRVISCSVNLDKSIREVVEQRFEKLSIFLSSLKRIAERYADEKRSQQLMDFDDLLANLCLILRDEGTRKRVAGRYSHVLVDEYQDTNPLQARITLLLGKDHRNVTAVGDDAQSIYGFRGSDVENIRHFPRMFAPAKVVKLEDNYRSLGGIISLANGVIGGGHAMDDKILRAVRGKGGLPVRLRPKDGQDEAEKVCGMIAGLISEDVMPEDIAVLFRIARHSELLELALVRAGIAFTKYGGQKYLEKAHVRDYLAFLKVARDPASPISLIRVLSMLPGVGAKKAGDLAGWAGGDRDRLRKIAEAPLPRRSQEGAARLGELFSSILLDTDEMGDRPGLVRDYYMSVMPGLYKRDWQHRMADVELLSGRAADSETVFQFLESMGQEAGDAADPEEVAEEMLLDPEEHKARTGGVVLTTIHSAKGLEWRYVFILSVVQGSIPFFYALKDPELLEEERRLFYVAVTRARDGLWIMSPCKVMAGKYEKFAEPSRFLDVSWKKVDDEGTRDSERSAGSGPSGPSGSPGLSGHSDSSATSGPSVSSVSSGPAVPVETSRASKPSEPAETPKPSRTSRSSKPSGPAETPKPSRTSRSSKPSGPVETSMPSRLSGTSKSARSSKSLETSKSSRSPKLSESSESSEIANPPKPSKTSKSARSSKPPEPSKISEQSVTSKAARSSKPSEPPKPSESSESTETPKGSGPKGPDGGTGGRGKR